MQARHEEQVNAVRSNLETLFESINDMLFILGQDGVILYANTATIDELGYSLDELRQMNLLDLHPLEAREKALKNAEEMSTGARNICQMPVLMKSGETIPVETKITHGTWNGKPALFGISRDISERLKSQSALVESERKFRELTEYLPLPLIETDRQGIVTYINHSGQEFFALSAEELQQGMSAFSFCIPEEFEMVLANQTKMLDPDYIPKGNEYTVTMKDGRRVPRLLYSTPIRLEDGQVSGIRTTVVDLTELKRAEEALRENVLQKRVSAEFRSIIDNIPGFVYHTSEDGNIKFLSQSTFLATNELLPILSRTRNHALSFVHPEDHQLVIDTYHELTKSLVSKVIIFRIVLPGGDLRWIEDRQTSVFSVNGQFSGIDGILFDITDRMRAQEEKQQFEQSLKKTSVLKPSARLPAASLMISTTFSHRSLAMLKWAWFHSLKTPNSMTTFPRS
ncbi:MAG: PAS domain S-box protein [Chlorobaculum sp.]|nr:PAS domain S-box protein [Chlorobaculum sp.]